MIKAGGGAFDPQDRNIYFLPTSTNMQNRIATGGGTFSPDDRHLYFIASNVDRMKGGAMIHPYILLPINNLNSETDHDSLQLWMDMGHKVFIDSGVYDLAMGYARDHNVSMDVGLSMNPEDMEDFEPLFEKYVEIVKRYEDRLWGYVEIDQGGRENKIKTRARLEALGLRPMPVYHPLNDGWDYFDYLAQRYDRICFGNLVRAPRSLRVRLLATLWERKARYPDLWVHLLGVTPNPWFYAYPPDSSDSSTWMHSIRWSGKRDRAMNQPIGELPLDLQYVMGSDRTSDVGSEKATRMAAYQEYFNLKNWQHVISRYREEKIQIYPNGRNDT